MFMTTMLSPAEASRLEEFKKRIWDIGLMEGGTHLFWGLIGMVVNDNLSDDLPKYVLAHIEGHMTADEAREYILLAAKEESTSKGVWRGKPVK